MSSPQVLRILKKDGSGEHLLVYITSAGRTPKTLDLNLVGTDTTTLYEASIRDASTKSLQSNQFMGSINEWKTVLAFVLLDQRPEGSLPEYLEGVEIVGEISASKMIVTIRRSVGSISQSLGSIAFQQNDEVVIELFDWVNAAAAASEQYRSQFSQLQKSSTEQQDEIARLKAELEELVEAKKKHDQELLSKFAALLNEKKLKIRDQQRLLSHSKVDPDIAEDVKSSREKSHVSRKAGDSSRSKRKVIDEDEDGEETPPQSGEETEQESEDEDEEQFAPAPAASQASNRRSAAPQSQLEARMDVDNDPLPPRRELPFSRPSKAKEPSPPTSSVTQPAAEENEEESSDDEL